MKIGSLGILGMIKPSMNVAVNISKGVQGNVVTGVRAYVFETAYLWLVSFFPSPSGIGPNQYFYRWQIEVSSAVIFE